MEILTIEQEQEYTRDLKVSKFLSDNQTVVTAYAPLLARQGDLDTHIAELQALAGIKASTTSGITDSKATKKVLLGNFYESLCGGCRDFLIGQNNTDDAANFNITKAKIVHLADGEVASVIDEINGWITNDLIPNALFTPYGITAATVAAGNVLKLDFMSSIGSSLNVEATKSGAGVLIERKVDELRTDIFRIDLLVRNFMTTNALFYESFQAIKVIDDIGVHHNGIKGDVTKAGVAVRNASITCTEANKSTKTNILGHYEIPSMKSGTFEFVCVGPAGETITKIIQIKKGKTIEVDWDFAEANGGGGGNTQTITIPGSLGMTVKTTIPTGNIHATPTTVIKLLITGGTADVFGSDVSNGLPGAAVVHAQDGVLLTFTPAEFEAATGLGESRPFLVIQNTSPTPITYTFTFENVEA